MAVTNVRGRQLRDDDVFREDLNTSVPGSAVIRKIIAGTNITISSTGVDAGTGDVTINATGGGTGTVTSVGLALPNIFSITVSPITTSGTLTAVLINQNANLVFAGPVSGVQTAPTFRLLNALDIPNLDAAKITSGFFAIARGGTGLTALGTANQILRVNAGGTALEYFTFTGVTGSGTAGTIPIWSGTSSLADSVLTYNGTNLLTFTSSSEASLKITSDGQGFTQANILFQSGTNVANTPSGRGLGTYYFNEGNDVIYYAGNPYGTSGVTDSFAILRLASATFNGAAADPNTATALLSVNNTSSTFSNQIISTRGNNTSNGGGQIYLNGATGNRIDFNVNGVAAPTTTTRSAGTKIVLYPVINAVAVDYALGIESSTLWFSVPETSNTFKWYGQTATMMSLSNYNLIVGPTATYYSRATLYAEAAGQSSDGLTIVTRNTTASITHVSRVYTQTAVTTGNGRTLIYAASPNTTNTRGQLDVLTEDGGSFISRLGLDITGVDYVYSVYSIAGLESFRFNTSGNSWLDGGNVGIGTTSPTEKLDVRGNALVRSAQPTILLDRNGAYTWRIINGDGVTHPLSTFNIANNANAAVLTALNSGQVRFNSYTATNSFAGTLVGYIGFTSDGSLITTTGVVTASGTANRIAVFTGASTLGDSSITDNGNTVTVLGNTSFARVANLPATTGSTLVFADDYTTPDAGRLIFGDATGWRFHISRRASSTTTDMFTFSDSGNLTSIGQYISTQAWVASNGGGQIFLNGTTGNRIDFAQVGVGAPAFTTRSAGTKIVFRPEITGSFVDYAMGINSNTLWYSVPDNASHNYLWYGGITVQMGLYAGSLVVGSGGASGKLTVYGAAGGTSLYLTDATNSTLYITHNAAGRTSFFNGSANQWMAETGGNVTIGNSTSAPAKLWIYNTVKTTNTLELTTQATEGTLQNTVPLRLNDLYNNGNNGHNLIVNSSFSAGVAEYNITKTWDGILTLGVANNGTSLIRHLYLYSSGQLRLANYTATSSFTGTAAGVLAFTADGSIITIPTPSGGSSQWTTNVNDIYYNTGNVGIGATSPLAKLDVRGDGVKLRLSTATSPSTYYFEIESRYDSANTVNFYGTAGNEFLRYIYNNNSLILQPVGGSVSIGTTTSDARLRVAGPFNGTQAIFGIVDGRGLEIATRLVAGTNEAGSVLNARGASSGQLIIQTDSTDRVFIDSTGLDVNLSTGIAIGSKTNRRRIQYGSDNATSFTLLTDTNSYAGLFAGATYATGGLFVRDNGSFGIDSGSLSLLNATKYVTYNTAAGNILTIGIQNQNGLDAGSIFRYVLGLSGNATGQSLTLSTVTTGGTQVERFGFLRTGQLRLNNYTATNSFNATTLVGYLGFDANGNILSALGTSNWVTSGNDVYYTAGEVAIGTTVPRGTLEIRKAAANWNTLGDDAGIGHILLSEPSDTVMQMGINTNKGWLQVRSYLGPIGQIWPFYINPIGGGLIVGSETSDGVGTFQLNGTMSFRTNATVAIPAIRFLPKNSLINSPAQGDLETDTNALLYYTYNTGDRGVVENSHYMCLQTNYTLTSSTAAQRIFNTATNGTMAVEALLYEFEMVLYITNFSTGNNGSLNLSFTTGGGATLTSIMYRATAFKGTVTTPNNAQTTLVNTAANSAITASNTGGAAIAHVRGIMRFSSGGTIRPTITLSVATAALVQTNSFFKMTPLGGNGYTSIGSIG